MEYRELLELGQKFHGHKCPAMPLGLRASIAAMKKLGVSHAADGQLLAIVELDENHCATCFADGVQVATGCTFGKGNIRKTGYGKWGLTLVDRKNGKAVRVVPKSEVMQKNKETEFMKLRKSGMPASAIANEIVDPLIEMLSNAPDEALVNIGEITDFQENPTAHSFETQVCAKCGEMVVERNMRIMNGKAVCIPCSGYDR